MWKHYWNAIKLHSSPQNKKCIEKSPNRNLLHEKKEEEEKKKTEKQEKFSRTVITLENLSYLRQWESARYSKSSKSSTSRGCVVVVERRRWEPSALPWRGEAKEEQKGAAHGEKAYVVGDGRGEGGGRRRERYRSGGRMEREGRAATQSRPARAVPGATFRRCYTRHRLLSSTSGLAK